MISVVLGGKRTAAGVWALLPALLLSWERIAVLHGKFWVKFVDNCLKATVCGETAGVFSPLPNLWVLKANDKHVGLRLMQKCNDVMLL